MKKVTILLTCVILMLFTAGCTSNNVGKTEIASPVWMNENNILAVDEWPQNKFSEKIPEPPVGKIDYVIDGSENGKYAIFYTDISIEEAEAYIAELKEFGYHSVADKKESVAIGVILEKDNVGLSRII